jgi:L-aspartate oxidase
MSSPILIVGGGLAGLFCALKLAPRPVTLLATAPIGEGASSAWAQGGVAAAMSEGDSPEKHTEDTVIAGAGTVDRQVVLDMAREASDRIHDLLAYGVPFDRDLEGHLLQSREAAHSERRIVRVKGDAAGKAIMEALVAAVRRTPSITLREGFTAEELIVRDGRVEGVLARARNGLLQPFPAAATVLATGGIGQLYRVTTNPPEARGIGLAIAAEAGAVIADAEFVQFHPTAIDVGRDPAPLATEALRGEGATLINRAGERFMQAIHPDAELAPRDIVARGVFAEISAGHGAFLDARSAIGKEFPHLFPTVYASCMAAGVDPVTDPIPVAPAEHYHMGGIATDARGQTSLPGLLAAGECASTGVHGANRLASNSLLEAVVFAARIADDLRDAVLAPPPAPPLPRQDNGRQEPDRVSELRSIMQDCGGVVRDRDGLMAGLSRAVELRTSIDHRPTRAMATTALLVLAGALQRRESRGGHFRSDFPEPDPVLAARSMTRLGDVLQLSGSL